MDIVQGRSYTFHPYQNSGLSVIQLKKMHKYNLPFCELYTQNSYLISVNINTDQYRPSATSFSLQTPHIKYLSYLSVLEK